MNRKTMLGDPPAIHIKKRDLAHFQSDQFIRLEIQQATVALEAKAAPFQRIRHPGLDTIFILTPVGALVLGLEERKSISRESLHGRTTPSIVLHRPPSYCSA